MLKAVAVLAALGYCSLLVYQGGVTFNFQESRPGAVQVSDLSSELEAKSSVVNSVQKPNLTLNDIFISVKTSRHYQFTRLPIILKTWFQLAKNQVSGGCGRVNKDINKNSRKADRPPCKLLASQHSFLQY